MEGVPELMDPGPAEDENKESILQGHHRLDIKAFSRLSMIKLWSLTEHSSPSAEVVREPHDIVENVHRRAGRAIHKGALVQSSQTLHG